MVALYQFLVYSHRHLLGMLFAKRGLCSITDCNLGYLKAFLLFLTIFIDEGCNFLVNVLVIIFTENE